MKTCTSKNEYEGKNVGGERGAEYSAEKTVKKKKNQQHSSSTGRFHPSTCVLHKYCTGNILTGVTAQCLNNYLNSLNISLYFKSPSHIAYMY